MKTLYLLILGMLGITPLKAAAANTETLEYEVMVDGITFANRFGGRFSIRLNETARSKSTVGELLQAYNPLDSLQGKIKLIKVKLYSWKLQQLLITWEAKRAFWNKIKDKYPHITEQNDFQSLPMSDVDFLKPAVLMAVYVTLKK